MKLEDIRSIVAQDIKATNALIIEQLSSDVVLINQLGHHIVNSGGKRLRPLLVLLSAGACGYQGCDHTALAAVIEFIHTATLLHDDVVDGSELRRGKETSNAIWGNEASVLVGDFLYSRAFQMMVSTQNLSIMAVMADATNTIAEGEVLQLLNCHDPDITEQQYREVIYRKTAKLFEAAAQVGGLLAGQAEHTTKALSQYGAHLGIAFQLIDDVLDYTGSTETIGKNVGDDLADGKVTMPLIHILRQGDEAQKKLVRASIQAGKMDDFCRLQAAVKQTGADTYTLDAARKEIDTALSALTLLPENPYTLALRDLALFAINRDN